MLNLPASNEEPSGSPRNRWIATYLGMVFALTALAGTNAASAKAATYRIPKFAIGDCSKPRRRADPINVVFVGARATSGNSRDLVKERNPFWNDFDGFPAAGSHLRIIDQGNCRDEDHQVAEGYFNKHHTRFWQLTGQQHDNYVTIQDAHRDVKRDRCRSSRDRTSGPYVDTVLARMAYKNRMLSGFDLAQRELLDAYPERRRGMQPGPNREPFRKCDPQTGRDQDVRWNGIIQFFTVNAGY